MMEADAVQVAAPAKINLALHITGQREDGYHLIETLAVFTRYSDIVTVEPGEADRLRLTGPYAAVTPAGGENIVMRALDAYRDFTGIKTGNIAVTVEKNLPVASGIGGGSSDAAALLKAIDRRQGGAAGREGLMKIGSLLGADLPMCLSATALIARGTGEQIEPAEQLPALAIALVNPDIEVSTRAVFEALTEKRNRPLPESKPGMSARQVIEWLEETRNDLEGPACNLFPQIAEARRALREAGAGFARMTGSGATCFGIFSDAENARQAASRIKSSRPEWFAVATETKPSGDADGTDR